MWFEVFNLELNSDFLHFRKLQNTDTANTNIHNHSQNISGSALKHSTLQTQYGWNMIMGLIDWIGASVCLVWCKCACLNNQKMSI